MASTSDSLELIDSGVAKLSTALLTTLAYLPSILIVGNVTLDANDAITSADVLWPDGTQGTFTALVLSTDFPGAVDSYQITYSTVTYTQPTVTRNTHGYVTVRPEMVVS